MKLLLDTHVVLWWLDGVSFRAEAEEAIRRPSSIVCVSAASAWEMGIKAALGKLRLPVAFAAHLQAERFTQLPVRIAHGLEVAALPLHHTDPFDRLLIAQARLEGLTIVTRDERLAEYGVPVLAA
ncbi:MAG TPA: type II toxin-antitoxin system VapC family toxin [Gaiella sp.]|jgi:PIN domain nuclease of toxin-antitoxin system|nr:type II toxin-antitoxin system VapC family toxin [Gaiella sp.]